MSEPSSAAVVSTITYHQKWQKCGKARCRKCREGQGHGPYWYAHEQVNGKVVQRYIGPHLPPGVSPTSHLHIGRQHAYPLIGRTTEQQALRALLDGLEHPESPRQQTQASFALRQGILITGEAGIGKTRLAEEVGREAQERGWCILWSRSYEQEQGIPYLLWRDIVRKASRSGWINSTQLRQQVRAFPTLQAFLPEFADAGESLPEQEAFRLHEAVLDLLVTISKHVPLLVVCDDIQWSDERSGDLFAFLVRRLHGSAIALLGTYRENELSTHHHLSKLLADLRREQELVTVSLQPLSSEHIGTLVGSLPHILVQQIQRQAAGNPLFAEELARSFATTTAQAQPNEQPLPETIAAVLDLRIERLSQSCQRLLSTAAVLGGSFELAVLVRMEVNGTDPTDKDTVLDLLEEAMRAGVLNEEGRGIQITYHFWHPLFTSQLYDHLSITRRASLHRRAAAVFQDVYRTNEEEGAATITRHLVEGGSIPQHIIHYAELAGNRAYVLSAYSEAEYHYHLAVQQYSLLLEQPEDVVSSVIALLEHLGECLMIQGKYDEARQCYERELALLTRGEQNDEVQRSAMLWGEIAWSWRYTGDTARSHECREQGEALLRAAGMTAGPAWASLRYQYSNLCWQEGRYDEALVAAQEAIAMFEQQTVTPLAAEQSRFPLTRIQRTLAGDPVDRGRMDVLLAAIAATIGQNQVAITHLQTAIAIFEQYDRHRERAIASGNLGDLHLRMAEYPAAQEAFRRSLTIAERIGDVPIRCVGVGNLGVVALQRGTLREAEGLLREALALAQQINDVTYISIWQSYLARVLHHQGRFEEASHMTVQALQGSRHAGIAPCVGAARFVLGMLQLQRGHVQHERHDEGARPLDQQRLLRAKATFARIVEMDEIEAETRIEAQLALAHCLLLLSEQELARRLIMQAQQAAHVAGSPWLIACASRLLGSLSMTNGQYEEAKDAFHEALYLFGECGMYLELADTLQQYGEALTHHLEFQAIVSQQAESVLEESRHLFHECLT
ncbi:MAG: DUF6788 family protein [Ktedonobacteraceae bacterium]